MTWFADLSRCNCFPVGVDSNLIAVGWLDQAEPFTTGVVDRRAYDRLRELLADPW